MFQTLRPTYRQVHRMLTHPTNPYVRLLAAYYLRYLLPSEEVLDALCGIVGRTSTTVPSSAARVDQDDEEATTRAIMAPTAFGLVDDAVVSVTEDGATTTTVRAVVQLMVEGDELYEAWLPQYWATEVERQVKELPDRQKSVAAVKLAGSDSNGKRGRTVGEEGDATTAVAQASSEEAPPPRKHKFGQSVVPGFSNVAEMVRYITSLPIMPASGGEQQQQGVAADGRFILDSNDVARDKKAATAARASITVVEAVAAVEALGDRRRAKRRLESGPVATQPSVASAPGGGFTGGYLHGGIIMVPAVTQFVPKLTGDVAVDAPVPWLPESELQRAMQLPAPAGTPAALAQFRGPNRMNDGGWTMVF
jgi:hypothetical protein